MKAEEWYLVVAALGVAYCVMAVARRVAMADGGHANRWEQAAAFWAHTGRPWSVFVLRPGGPARDGMVIVDMEDGVVCIGAYFDMAPRARSGWYVMLDWGSAWQYGCGEHEGVGIARMETVRDIVGKAMAEKGWRVLD